VNLSLLDQLEAMFHSAQEAVGQRQRRSVRPVDVPGRSELSQRRERGREPDRLVSSAVNELQ
jgi:hypothetical protein